MEYFGFYRETMVSSDGFKAELIQQLQTPILPDDNDMQHRRLLEPIGTSRN